MRPSSCCCIVVRQSSARLSGVRPPVLASGEPVEPDSEEARQGKARLEGVPYPEVGQRVLRFASSSCACPPSESPSAHSKHPSLLPSPRKKTGRPATVSRTGQDPSQTPKDFPIPNGTRIHFSIILPDVPPSFHALHREIALPTDWNAKGSIGWSRTSPQFLALASLSNVACCCLMLLTPCHAMPLADVLMLMTDARRGARPCACACFAGNSSSHMSFVLHSSSPTVHSSAAASRALALITHTRHAASDWNSGLPGLSAHCSHPWKSRLRAILVRMLGAPVSKRRFPNTAAHARPCPYLF